MIIKTTPTVTAAKGSGGFINFSAKDFPSVITLEDLTALIKQEILNIRSQNTAIYQQCYNDIQQLINNTKSIDKRLGVANLRALYDQIISISMRLRNSLGIYESISDYNGINYVFYYKGQRYFTDHLETPWLGKSKAKGGGLRVYLNRATKDLEKQLQNSFAKEIQQLVNEHYQAYLNAIQGMYEQQNKRVLGKDRLTRGHVAEAFEGHLTYHHPDIYQYLNMYDEENSILDHQALLKAQGELDIPSHYWADHETPEPAWRHISQSLGNQRGTVAGDVYDKQVKQAYRGSGGLALTSLQNLEKGFKNYSQILDPHANIDELARKIALYLTEKVSKRERRLYAKILKDSGIEADINNLYRLG